MQLPRLCRCCLHLHLHLHLRLRLRLPIAGREPAERGPRFVVPLRRELQMRTSASSLPLTRYGSVRPMTAASEFPP